MNTPILDPDEWTMWLCACALAFALAYSAPGPCEEFTEGSDSWAECVYGEELDLTPTEGS